MPISLKMAKITFLGYFLEKKIQHFLLENPKIINGGGGHNFSKSGNGPLLFWGRVIRSRRTNEGITDYLSAYKTVLERFTKVITDYRVEEAKQKYKKASCTFPQLLKAYLGFSESQLGQQKQSCWSEFHFKMHNNPPWTASEEQ